MVKELQELLAGQTNVVLALDGWTNARGQSIIAYVVILANRRAYLFHTEEASSERHTAEHLAGDL